MIWQLWGRASMRHDALQSEHALALQAGVHCSSCSRRTADYLHCSTDLLRLPVSANAVLLPLASD